MYGYQWWRCFRFILFFGFVLQEESLPSGTTTLAWISAAEVHQDLPRPSERGPVRQSKDGFRGEDTLQGDLIVPSIDILRGSEILLGFLQGGHQGGHLGVHRGEPQDDPQGGPGLDLVVQALGTGRTSC